MHRALLIAVLGSSRKRKSALTESDTVNLLLQQIIDLRPHVSDGLRLVAVALPWIQIAKEIEQDAAVVRRFAENPERWEDFLAGAYDREGYKVTVGPPNKQGRRLVVAEKHGIGSIRILDQPKALAPGKPVVPDDLREMLSVLNADRNASKGVVTTTSIFQSDILSSEEFKPYMPNRLELRDHEGVQRWITELRERGRLGGDMNSASARGYFEIYVRPSLSEWRESPDDLRRATTLANHLNNCVDRICHHDNDGQPSPRSILDAFRNALAVSCPEFAIIRDIADAEKHVELTRQSRRLSRHDQTRRTGSFSRGFSDGFDVVRIVAEDDNGAMHEFDNLVPVVVSRVEAELADRGL